MRFFFNPDFGEGKNHLFDEYNSCHHVPATPRMLKRIYLHRPDPLHVARRGEPWCPMASAVGKQILLPLDFVIVLIMQGVFFQIGVRVGRIMHPQGFNGWNFRNDGLEKKISFQLWRFLSVHVSFWVCTFWDRELLYAIIYQLLSKPQRQNIVGKCDIWIYLEISPRVSWELSCS